MELKAYINQSVLCWLATVGEDLMPNVSPKEVFTLANDDTLLIANIASPISERNIYANANVCVSLIDVFEQRGFKLKGSAKVIDIHSELGQSYLKSIREIADESYPVKNIFEVCIESKSKIVAPSYFLFPNTTAESQIKSAMKTYHVSPRLHKR
ncbi:pyridoxamine 5'-phosphate oxidase family protein [Pseudoalteromonas sp. SMS1]|uniref:pyridoxamine 5'-phosphate oxidase family protein n=1 Tax=Pseudoalteromonas sp. SMS1 TaxID=2908894 RepID=UPI001F289B45|nr:pyridoxamine 5'-phosphate oxidase family protein [Pseudoalteromonas sp. SMS1]MCF2859523.1 pyridoxamine 5'-phosphate oxidase family protein [Pseudoalteromonas sp. SMS1]